MNSFSYTLTRCVTLVMALTYTQSDAFSHETHNTPEVSVAEYVSNDAFSPVQSNSDGVAIDGFDPVAYFDQGAAVRGIAAHNCEYRGKQWYFSSEENRDKFLANPEKFTPEYGGYCAHSLSSNRLIESNPNSFLIRDGKLHLYVNDSLAQKDARKDQIKFDFDQKVRDNNWLTFQSEF